MKKKMFVLLALIVAVLLLIVFSGMERRVSSGQAEKIAVNYLKDLGLYPDNVNKSSVGLERGEKPWFVKNNYWEELAGKKKARAGIYLGKYYRVTFYHDAHHPDHQVTVYVSSGGNILGGIQCK